MSGATRDVGSGRQGRSGPPFKIFISHSSEDIEGKLFVYDLLNGSRFSPDFYPLDNPGPPHANRIAERVASSVSLFVMLSDPMAKRSHTRAWVGFEVGVAAMNNIPVVVIESEGVIVDLPVPGATHYIRRPGKLPKPIPPEWVKLLTTGGMLKEIELTNEATTLGGKLLEGLANIAASGYDVTRLFKKAVCEAANCRAAFWVPDSLFGAKRVPCPTCRYRNASFRVSLMEFSERLQQQSDKTV